MNKLNILDDGTIDGMENGNWLYWEPGESEACLDGNFSSAELRAIADHMDSRKAAR